VVVSQYLLLSPPFGFFRKKEASKERSVDDPTIHYDAITLEQASSIVERVMTTQTQSMLIRLEPIKRSVENTLDNLSKIVDDLSRENLKTDDTKFRSLVENSRRTIVSTITRESSSQLALPQNLNEALEFRSRLESLLKRFGDASGSHRRVLNEYMKKHSNKMKDEFETLSRLHKKTHELVSKAEAKANECSSCLRVIQTSQETKHLIEVDQSRISTLSQQNKEEQILIDKLKNEAQILKSSQQYLDAFQTLEEIKRIEGEKEKLKKDTSNMFSNISRAITKYSYGTSKTTYSKLEKIGSRPWEIFDEDIMPYLKLLQGIRQELISGKMTLKDSSRTIEHIDQIMNSLENISSEIKEKNDLLSQLRSSGAGQIQSKLWLVETEITSKIEFVSNRNQEVSEAKEAMENRSNEMKRIVRQIEEEILEITDKKYSIKIPYP
jgi:myosin heavy subunit